MRDPELIQRAERTAIALERALIHWRQQHGLDSEPLQPVTSYVGYSATEPWGQPRVVLGIHVEEAERLTAMLDGHDCIGPVHAGISGWPTQRQADGTWVSVTAGPASQLASSSPSGLPAASQSVGAAATAIPAVPFIAPVDDIAASDLQPLPPQEFADADPVPPVAGATAQQFAGPAATWSELADHGSAPGELPADAVKAARAATNNKRGASPPAAPPRRRVVAPRPRVSPDDSPILAEQPDQGSAQKRQAPSAPKRTKSGEPGKDRPARTRLQPASKSSTRPRRTTGQRPSAGSWPAVDGQPSPNDKSG